MLFAKPIKKAHYRGDYSDFESHQCNLESEHIQFVITSVLTEKCMLRKQWLSSKKNTICLLGITKEAVLKSVLVSYS